MKKIPILLATIALTSCTSTSYLVTEKSLIVHPTKSSAPSKNVKIQVLDDGIVHVAATPEKNFAKDSSLIIVPHTNPISFQLKKKGDSLSITTKKIRVNVSRSDGGIRYYDLNGKLLLAEAEGGGKSYVPIDVEGKKGYTVEQIFNSPANESFYGLGQHQSDEFNYKNKSEELFQYNTKVSVPFVISNKKYGVLWDSNALSRFGDSRPYQQLGEVFKIYDKEGNEGFLSGLYTSRDQGVKSIARKEPSLFFEDIKSIKNLPQGFPLKNADVEYQGFIEAPEDGTYKFTLYYAGYMKVYVDNKLVVPERWRTAWNPNSYKFTIDLKAAKKVPIKIEWKPDGGVSYCGLRALPPQPSSEKGNQVWWSEMNQNLNYYFVYGDHMDDVVKGYRTLTGKSQIMPKWAMGYWQSRERYKTQDEILGTLKEFRSRKIPIDNIVLDWNYWYEDDWGSHKFDMDRFPNPKKMVDSIHDMHAKIMISVWPKFYKTTEHFKEFDQKGWMYQQAIKDNIKDWVGPGYVGSFYDAYAPGARKLFWKQIRETLYPLGIDAWWMDASEPNVLDCTDMEYRKELSGPTALGPSTEYFNAYALMNAEAIYDGQRSVAPNNRVFLLTRSGFAGLQRYSTATWSGDIGTRWEDMKAQISAGLNFSVSGIPYWTMDIGGFCVEDRYVAGQIHYNKTGEENADYKEWRELNARWFQFGAFAPLYRAHGQYPFREPWNIAPKGHPAYESIVYYTNLRYRIMPYIYTLAGMTHFNDYTIMRPLVMDYAEDKTVENIGDQYMFGSSFLINPVYKYGATSREVYFPKTVDWYDFYTGKIIKGGQRLAVPAPYEKIPIFIPQGAIIPVGPEMQYSNEKPADQITLYVYDGKNGHFSLYEDEGTNYNYEKGNYASIPFDYNTKNHQLTIGKRNGEFNGMLKNRTFNVVLITPSNPVSFGKEVKGIEVNYTGNEVVLQLNN